MQQTFKAIRISDHVYWVGAIDWNLRNFHGYATSRGTTYNAYLILADKITLIDTVKAEFKDEMMARIASIVNPADITYIVSNHAELDHTGCLPEVIDSVQPERVLASAMGVKALQDQLGIGSKITAVKDGESLNLGNFTLTFIASSMLHWPDSMCTHMSGENMLFSQDAFGMHLASAERFSNELDPSVLEYEAGKYFANILMPYSNKILKFAEKLAASGLALDLIAPDHGPVWKDGGKWIIGKYAIWAARKPNHKAVVVFDTMWNSTEMMARAIAEGLTAGGAEVRVMPLGAFNRSDVAYELLEAGALIVGSPTLNNQMFPTVADVLTYVKGLEPKTSIGAAFGSFGWSAESVTLVNDALKEMKIPDLFPPIKAKYRPDSATLKQCYDLGTEIAAKLTNKNL